MRGGFGILYVVVVDVDDVVVDNDGFWPLSLSLSLSRFALFVVLVG